MKHRGVGFVSSILVGGLLVPAAGAQSYGPEQQVFTVAAADFRSMSPSHTLLHTDGYLYFGGDQSFIAPLALPEGALIEQICLYANDSDPGAEVQAELLASKLVPADDSPYQLIVGSNVSSGFDIGYGYECTNSFSYTLRGKTDLDNDGIVDVVAYYVHAIVPPPTQNALGLGGVRIFWRRHVSDPPAAPTFGDVPASDPAFAHIEALAASGITGGCNAAPPLYCPDAKLTRRQMAVFLAKALGLHWTD